jgi:hypothetical protein
MSPNRITKVQSRTAWKIGVTALNQDLNANLNDSKMCVSTQHVMNDATDEHKTRVQLISNLDDIVLPGSFVTRAIQEQPIKNTVKLHGLSEDKEFIRMN